MGYMELAAADGSVVSEGREGFAVKRKRWENNVRFFSLHKKLFNNIDYVTVYLPGHWTPRKSGSVQIHQSHHSPSYGIGTLSY